MGEKCVATENKKIGTKKIVREVRDGAGLRRRLYRDWKDVFKGKVDDLTKCIDWNKESTSTSTGPALKDEDAGRQDKTVCTWCDVIDPTSETGYRDTVNSARTCRIGTVKVCTDWEKIEILQGRLQEVRAEGRLREAVHQVRKTSRPARSQVCAADRDEDVFRRSA